MRQWRYKVGAFKGTSWVEFKLVGKGFRQGKVVLDGLKDG